MADNYSRDAYHLSIAGKRNYQPLRENNFELVIDFSNTLGMKGFAQEDSDNIKVGVISCNAPHFRLNEVGVRRFNSQVYYAGTPEFSSDTIRINDFYGKSGKSGVMRWLACAYDVDNDAINDADNYMATATLTELKPNGDIVRTWRLENCWIQSIQDDTFNAESNSKKTFSATMRYDRAYPIEI